MNYQITLVCNILVIVLGLILFGGLFSPDFQASMIIKIVSSFLVIMICIFYLMGRVSYILPLLNDKKTMFQGIGIACLEVLSTIIIFFVIVQFLLK